MVDPQFKRFAWRYLAALEIASVVWALFVAALGLCAFLAPKYNILTAVIFLLTYSTLFCYSSQYYFP